MTPELPPDAALFQLIYGYLPSQLVYVAARLGIADHIHDSPKSSVELAPVLGANQQALQRVLRGLVNSGLLAEEEGGRFSLTPMGEYLRTDIPGSLRELAILNGGEFYPAWGALHHTLQTGETAFDHAFGTGFFHHLARNTESGTRFNNFMVSLTAQTAAAVLEAYDFAPFTRLVDVGGGYGAMLAAILKANSEMTGVLLDTAPIVEGAGRYLEAEGVADRCEIIAGDFFESVPGGGDAYVLSQVLHDWDDDRCVGILKNCRRAKPDHGKLLVIEAVMPERVEEPVAVVDSDLIMLVVTGGRERTEAEYRSLFTASGFRLERIIPTSSPMCVIEGAPVVVE